MPKRVMKVMKEWEMQHLITKVEDFLHKDKRLKFFKKLLKKKSTVSITLQSNTHVSKPVQF